MTTPPPPWEAHPPLPEDEFGDASRVRPDPNDDPDEITGPIRVAQEQDAVTAKVRTDQGSHTVAAAAPTEYADTGAARTEMAPVRSDEATGFYGGAAEAINHQETAVARFPVDDRPRYGPPETHAQSRHDYVPGPGSYPPPAPRPEETYAVRFAAPLSVDPRSVPVRQKSYQPVIIAAAVAVVVLVGLAAWLLWPSDGAADQAADQRSSSTPTVDAEGHDKLMSLLPPGYASDACTADTAPEGAIAVVTCTENADAGGPDTATYTLLQDEAALDAALRETVDETRVVNCPGRIQSPGAWRRNADPDKAAGILVCGMPQQRAQVAWTTDSTLVLNVTRAGPDGPTLDQLFTWWQSHS